MKNLVLKIISTVIWILCVAGAVLYCVFFAGADTEYSTADIWLFILFFVLSFITASGIHELGHFVFGLLSGMSVKLSFKSVLPSLCSSFVEIIPRKEDNIKSRLIITALGGIVFNLIFIALGAVALFVPRIPIWIFPISIFHLSLFFDNVLPIEYKSGKSDGLIISGFLHGTPESLVMFAVLKVQAHILGGESIAECKDILFSVPQIREDDPAFISLTELRAMYFKAAGDDEGANEQYARFEELKREYIG